jgi:DNA-binding MarR family transcriptional regulator
LLRFVLKAGNKINTAKQNSEAVMINSKAKPQAVVTDVQEEAIRSLYMESLHLVERLHRRLLDVIKDEFDRQGRDDVNAVQALLLFNIGTSELTAGELRSRGYYLGSNVSYNVKKLVDLGFINHQRSRIDRRSVRISLTEKGQDIAETVAGLYERHIGSIEKVGGIGTGEFAEMNKMLQRLDRFWNDSIAYRL